MTHYYSEKQKSELRLNKINAFLKGKNFEFYAGSGVFSMKKIDKGTEILVNNAMIEDGWKILDLGCGYGAVGIAIKRLFQNTKITMADINERAIKLSKMNSKLNNVEIAIIKSNLYDALEKMKFNTILTNPPQSAGKAVCFEIIENAPKHLEKNGLLQLVARHNKGGRQLSKKMKEIFGNVKEIVKKSGYRVYVSENK